MALYVTLSHRYVLRANPGVQSPDRDPDKVTRENVRMAEYLEVEWAIPFAHKERFYSIDFNGQVTVRDGVEKRLLDGRTDLHDYSRTFEWGRNSAGAAQLSLAMLADALGSDARAQVLHHKFKNRVIVDLPERWTITRSRVLAHARMLEENAKWPTR